MNVKKYEGHEITSDVIRSINVILTSFINENDYTFYDIDIKSVEDLVKFYDTTINEIKLVIGSDWYLILSEGEYYVNLIEWVSKKNSINTFKKSIEMLQVFKEILLKNKGKIFKSDLIHTTSYRLYKRLVTKGYIKEISNSCYPMTPFSKFKLKKLIKDKRKINIPHKLAQTLDEYDDILGDYSKYFYHRVSFTVTEEFYKNHKKTLRKNKS